jgi:hypothetical protein
MCILRPKERQEKKRRTYLKNRRETTRGERTLEIEKIYESSAEGQSSRDERDTEVRRSDTGVEVDDEGNIIDPDEPRYCLYNRVSFGTMICCDNNDCEKGWFHLECVGLNKTSSETTKWYCPDCRTTLSINEKGEVSVRDKSDSAIQRYQEALNRTPTDQPDQALRLQNLGAGYGDRYRATGAMADLDTAIQLFQEALDRTPTDHRKPPPANSALEKSNQQMPSNSQGGMGEPPAIRTSPLTAEEQVLFDFLPSNDNRRCFTLVLNINQHVVVYTSSL